MSNDDSKSFNQFKKFLSTINHTNLMIGLKIIKTKNNVIDLDGIVVKIFNNDWKFKTDHFNYNHLDEILLDLN